VMRKARSKTNGRSCWQSLSDDIKRFLAGFEAIVKDRVTHLLAYDRVVQRFVSLADGLQPDQEFEQELLHQVALHRLRIGG
jgi:hypothetical protein